MEAAAVVLVVTAVVIGALAVLRIKKIGWAWGVDEQLTVRSMSITTVLIILLCTVMKIIADEPDGWWGALWVIPAILYSIVTILYATAPEWTVPGLSRPRQILAHITWGPSAYTGTPPAKKLQYTSAIVLAVVSVLAVPLTLLFAAPTGVPTAQDTPAVSAPASPASTAGDKSTKVAEPTKEATNSPLGSIKSKCGAPDLMKLPAAHTSSFHPQGVYVCNPDGKTDAERWPLWSGPGPSKITVTHAVEVGNWQYGAWTWNGKMYETRVKIDPEK
jgi:hypothetical protein